MKKMFKILGVVALVGIVGLFLLVSCANNAIEEINSELGNPTVGESNITEENKDEEKSFNQAVVDNDKAKITLVSVIKTNDSVYGDIVKVKFNVVNKHSQPLTVQDQDVSADGKMLENIAYASMSDTIAVGKEGLAELTIDNLGDSSLPEIKENIELKLHVWDEDYNYVEDIPVKIDLK